MQRIDDVTGETIRLSAAQRDEQRQQIVALIMQVARQTDLNTRGIHDLSERYQLHGVVEERLRTLEDIGIDRSLSLWRRVRWMVLGR